MTAEADRAPAHRVPHHHRRVVVLNVDDYEAGRYATSRVLRQAGFDVLEAATGNEALDVTLREHPDLVLLDVNLPDVDGFEVCRRIRQTSAVPVLMLTVRGEEEDVVRGLDLGADDYLTKPFSPKTLLARVRALLRRAGDSGPEELAAGPFRLDLERRTLAIEGRPSARLTPLELRLVQALLASAGEPVAAERLIAHIWGGRAEGDRQLLKQLVRRLRQKIERDPAAPELLETDTGVGYRLRLA